MKNKFLIPIGSDNLKYFSILEKYMVYIGGIYISWPNLPSGRENILITDFFFNEMYRWCLKNNKVFDIVFNMEPHDFKQGFDPRKINISPYKSLNTELTFSSIILLKDIVFEGFKKNLSINFNIQNFEQLYEFYKDNKSINSVVLNRDLNRNNKFVNDFIKMASNINVETDVLINEGCIPFCPNKKDHNIFITLSYFSNQRYPIEVCKNICKNYFKKDPSSILRSPFLTRDVLSKYNARFFKICDRKISPEMLEEILGYYINGRPIDIGIAFSVSRRKIGLTTDMIPVEFHKNILICGNKCYNCDKCSLVYDKMKEKN